MDHIAFPNESADYRAARRLIGLNDEIWAEMTTGCAGTVRLGVPYDLVGTALAPILKGFAEASPLVESQSCSRVVVSAPAIPVT